MTTNDLCIVQESVGSPEKVGSRWLVTVARPGKGATGTYTEEALKNTGPNAIPPGTKAFFKHALPQDRDPRDQVGVYEEGAFWNAEKGELQAILTPFPRYAQVLEEAGKNVEASIRVAARKRRGTDIVEEFVFSRENTVDLVSFGGLEGSGLQYQVESLFTAALADSEQDRKNKENSVEITPEMIVAQTAALTALSERLETFVEESLRERQAAVDTAALELAVETAVEERFANYAAQEQTIDAASILTVQKESLKARARKGEDITSDLAEAVSFVEEAKKELIPSNDNRNPRGRGNVVVVEESLKNETPNFKVGPWASRKASN